jgi:hypothetical protein
VERFHYYVDDVLQFARCTTQSYCLIRLYGIYCRAADIPGAQQIVPAMQCF